MKTFKINERIEIICESHDTRSGFKHTANLILDGSDVESTKVCYLNRTWESYQFQTVAKKIIEKSQFLSKEEKELCHTWLDGDRTDWSGFKTVSMIASLGNLFCDNQKDKNDWKLRMIKAGLENKGLIMPENWDTLDEDTKQARLDAIIQMTGELK